MPKIFSNVLIRPVWQSNQNKEFYSHTAEHLSARKLQGALKTQEF